MGLDLPSDTKQHQDAEPQAPVRFPLLRSQDHESFRQELDPMEEAAQWASRYAETIFSWEGSTAELNAHLGEVNQQFISEMVSLLNGDHRPKLLHALHQHSLEAFVGTREKLFEEVQRADQVFREDVELLVNNMGEEVGILRGRQGNFSAIAQRREEFSKLAPEIIAHLTRQILDGHPSSVKQHAQIETRMSLTLEDIWQKAERRGEERVLAAEEMAHTLRQSVSPSRKNREQIYKTLFPLPEDDVKLVAHIYEHRYGEPLLTTIERAHNSVVAKVKNFFQFPALRSALQDQYGIGAGLLSTWRVFVPKLRDFKSYPERVGDFIHRLRDKVASPDKHRVASLLSGERIKVASDTIYMAILYNDDAVATISTTLKGLDATDTKCMLRDFKKRYASRLRVNGLQEAIEQRFEGDERRLLLAYLAVDDLRGASIVFHDSLDERSSDRVQALLELHMLTLHELSEVRTRYTEEYGQEPTREYLQTFLKGPLLDWADALLQGDLVTASAARLEASLRGISDEWPGVVFYNHSKEADYAVIDTYEKLYKKNFFEVLKKKRGNDRSEIMEAFVEESHLTTAEQLRHCLVGAGDATGITQCLRRLTKEQQDKVVREYAYRYDEQAGGFQVRRKSFLHALRQVARQESWREKLRGLRAFRKYMREFATCPRDLDRDLKRKFCGHKYFDMQLLREGYTDDPKVLFGQLERRFRHETHHSLSFLSVLAEREHKKKFLGIWKRKPRHEVICMHQAVAEAKKFYQQRILGSTPTEDDKRKAALLCRIAQRSLDDYREYNRKRAIMAANIGSFATTTAALGGLAFFNLHYAPLAISIGVASYIGRHWFKQKYQGDGYGAREKGFDVFLSSVDGASLALGKWIKMASTLRVLGSGGSLGRGVLSAGTKYIFKKGLQKVGNGPIASILFSDQTSEHVVHLSHKERQELLAEVGSVLHGEADRGYVRRDRLFHRTPDIKRVFTRIGREIAAEASSRNEAH